MSRIKSFLRSNWMKAILVMVALVAVGLVLRGFNGGFAKHDGELTIEIKDIDGTELDSKNIKFYEGDSLIKLIEDNFEVEYDDGEWGIFINKIGDIDSASGNTLFIEFIINGVQAPEGVGDTTPEDGVIITFKLTDWS